MAMILTPLAVWGSLLRRLSGDHGALIMLLMLSSGFAVSMLGARVMKAEAWDYRFLLWNLILAWMPFSMALGLEALDRRRAPFAVLAGVGGAWLIFFPNAPYIVTDFIHLKQRLHVPLWYDILMLTAFAWTGLLLGFASLRICHGIVERRFGRTSGWLLVVGTLLLAGFGIYLGRFVRWNSWDIFESPLALLSDIAHRIAHPAAHPRTWGMTLVIGVFLFLGYATLLSLSRSLGQERTEAGA